MLIDRISIALVYAAMVLLLGQILTGWMLPERRFTMPTAQNEPIQKYQVKKIHALKSALQWDEETYRAVLCDGFGVTTSKELSTVQAGLLIRNLESKAIALGVWVLRNGKSKKHDDLNGRGGMATPPQLRKIEATWQEVSRASDPASRSKALRTFVMRVAKVSDLRFLDQDGASKVINALNKMKDQKTQNPD